MKVWKFSNYNPTTVELMNYYFRRLNASDTTKVTGITKGHKCSVDSIMKANISLIGFTFFLYRLMA